MNYSTHNNIGLLINWSVLHTELATSWWSCVHGWEEVLFWSGWWNSAIPICGRKRWWASTYLALLFLCYVSAVAWYKVAPVRTVRSFDLLVYYSMHILWFMYNLFGPKSQKHVIMLAWNLQKFGLIMQCKTSRICYPHEILYCLISLSFYQLVLIAFYLCRCHD